VGLGRRRDGGAAAVETALVLPILLLLVFGIIDFGRMLNAQITLTEAAREGARAVALDSAPEPRVATATQGLGGLDAVDISIEPEQGCGSSPSPDDDAQVTVTYTFSFITPVGALAGIFSGEGFGGDFTITGVGVMPCRA
jgi:Flp pilus assembly protein TadG